MESAHFVVGSPTEETEEYLRVASGGAPLEIVHLPLIFLSPPIDASSLRADLTQGEAFNFIPVHHGFVFNPRRELSEHLVFVQTEIDTLMTDLGVDQFNFRPYFRLSDSPMRTKSIRFWSKNFADSLIGRPLSFIVSVQSAPVLNEFFNDSAIQDHGHSYSDGL